MRAAVFLLVVLLTVSCGERRQTVSYGTAPSSTPEYGDMLIEGTIGEASNLIPFLSSDSASHEVAGFIYNGLVKYDENLNIVGDLAESFDVSADGLRLTFRLRKGVKWHDGREFTAEDCVFTHKIITDPATPTPYSGDFLQVKKVYAPDPHTFVVEYSEPFASALSSWGAAMVPKHLLEGRDVTKSELARNPVGTGPFMIENWTQGEKIVLKRNEEYFEGKPYLEKIVFRVIPDTATIFLELRSENIDFFSGITPVQYTRQARKADFQRAYNSFKYLAFAYTYLGFNLKRELFKDIRVRRAVAHAINKDEIIKGVLLGLGVEATGPYKPDMQFYNSDVERYAYDPALARKLLEQAGWRDTDGDGIVEKDGKPFRFTMLTNQGNDSRIKTCEILQKRLRQAGMEMKILVLEWATFIKEFVNPKRFDAVVLGWTIPQESDLYDIWHSSKSGKSGLNLYSYANPRVDELLVKGRKTVDRGERKKIYYEIQRLLASDLPCVFLYVPNALPVVHKRFRGVEPKPAGLGYNTYKWHVPKIEQKY